MANFQNVQNLTFQVIGGTLNNVSGNQSNTNNIAGPSSNPAGNASTIAVITSVGSGARLSLPPGSKRRPRLTTMFTGRQDILKQIIQFFTETQSSMALKTQKIFVLYGLGGTGKTSIMNKFVDQFSDQFSGVYYVDASTLATLQAGFESIARDASAGQTADDALRWLSQQRSEWLLLLDNADDPNINLHRYFPHCIHGNIIVTTRHKDCCQYAPNSNCRVFHMEPDDAIELLFKYTMVERSDENWRLCATIAQELGYLALAVAQAGAFISRSSCLNTYLQIYQTDRVELLRKHFVRTTDDYKWTVYTTWEMNLKQLSSTASTFLQICAFMHHEGISSKIFQKAAAKNPGNSFRAGSSFLRNFKTEDGRWSEIRFLDIIHDLSSHSLIDVHSNGDMYSIHPLVHSWARDRISAGEREEGRMWAMQILALAIPFDESSDGYAFRRSLLPHVDAAHVGNITTEIAETFSWVYEDCGRWNDAKELLKFAVEARTTELGDDHPETLNSMNSLVFTYNSQKRWKEAEGMGLKVLEARKRVLGDEHEDTLKSKNNLALTYDGQDRFIEAGTLCMEVLEASRRVLGDEHLYTLTTKHNLAISYAKQGQLKEAETLAVQVLEASRRVLGDEHPRTLYSQANLAWIYRVQRPSEGGSSPAISGRRGESEDSGQQSSRNSVGRPSPFQVTRAAVLKDSVHNAIAYIPIGWVNKYVARSIESSMTFGVEHYRGQKHLRIIETHIRRFTLFLFWSSHVSSDLCTHAVSNNWSPSPILPYFMRNHYTFAKAAQVWKAGSESSPLVLKPHRIGSVVQRNQFTTTICKLSGDMTTPQLLLAVRPPVTDMYATANSSQTLPSSHDLPFEFKTDEREARMKVYAAKY